MDQIYNKETQKLLDYLQETKNIDGTDFRRFHAIGPKGEWIIPGLNTSEEVATEILASMKKIDAGFYTLSDIHNRSNIPKWLWNLKENIKMTCRVMYRALRK